MRTTLAIDDDVLEAAKSLARTDGRSVGRVLSDLARRGLHPRTRLTERNGLPVFELNDDSPILTPEMVREALED